MKLSQIYTLACAALVLASCSKSDQWTVKGTIAGADGKTVILEAATNGRWYVIDSLRLDSDGSFAFSQAPVGYPEIYRLSVGDNSFYFPVDSLETVTLEADIANPAAARLSGSPTAEKLMEVDALINKFGAENAAGNIATNQDLKKQLSQIVVDDPSSVVAYYILNKSIAGKPLFDPADKTDVRVIGAVANAFTQYRPNDPRSNYLKNLFLANRQVSSSSPKDTLYAQELPIIEISLFDNIGQEQSLAQAAARNKVVLLSFTRYGAEFSPAYNVELNRIYEKYHDAGLEIYQISSDDDEYQWRQSAKNLPWITVYDPITNNSKHHISYNIVQLPTTFIIANGELTDRVEDLTKLSSTVENNF